MQRTHTNQKISIVGLSGIPAATAEQMPHATFGFPRSSTLFYAEPHVSLHQF